MTKHNIPDTKLRAIEPEDIEFLYEIENDPELWDIGITNVPYSRYALCDYLANTRNDIYADRQLRLIIEDAAINGSCPAPAIGMETNTSSIGIVDLINFDPRHMRAEVGIVIQKKYRRKGFACSALFQTTLYARQILHLHQLYAIISADNKASLTLFENAGFNCTATLKDWLSNGNGYQEACLMQLFT